jgi:hypothetical protein
VPIESSFEDFSTTYRNATSRVRCLTKLLFLNYQTPYPGDDSKLPKAYDEILNYKISLITREVPQAEKNSVTLRTSRNLRTMDTLLSSMTIMGEDLSEPSHRPSSQRCLLEDPNGCSKSFWEEDIVGTKAATTSSHKLGAISNLEEV